MPVGSPFEWHSFADGRTWRVVPNGIETREEGIYRTSGPPRTVNLYLAFWGRAILSASRETGVPVSLLLMTLATENGPISSRGTPRIEGNRIQYSLVREEPGYVSDEETPDRISIGPCHLLISTAREVMGRPDLDRGWLSDPANNLRACARYIASDADKTRYDPILVAADYNAGRLERALPGQSEHGNPWHLLTYGNHLDRAAAWYGDACRAIHRRSVVWSWEQSGMGRVDEQTLSKLG